MVYINLILKYWHDLNLNHIYVLLHMLNTARSVNFIAFEDRSKVWTMSCTEVLFHTFIWCWSFHFTSIWLFNSKTRELRRDPHPSPSFLICFFPLNCCKGSAKINTSMSKNWKWSSESNYYKRSYYLDSYLSFSTFVKGFKNNHGVGMLPPPTRRNPSYNWLSMLGHASIHLFISNDQKNFYICQTRPILNLISTAYWTLFISILMKMYNVVWK